MSGIEQKPVRLHAIVASRNIPEAWASECLDSLLSQAGVQLRITWTDDASDTGVPLALQSCPDPRLTVIENATRLGGLYNHVQPALTSDDMEVCCFIGGDDTIEAGAFERLSDIFSDPSVWLTYGTIRNSDGEPPHSGLMKHWNVRNHHYVFGPTTVRAALVKKINPEDLMLAGTSFYFPSAGDTALVMPLLEMSGPERTRYIEEPWYVRRIHASNDHKVSGRLQSYCGWEARCKPSYSRLRDLQDTPTRTPHQLGHGVVFVPMADEGALMAVQEHKETGGWQLLPGAWDQGTVVDK